MESGGSFHVININIVNSEGSAQLTTYGSIYNGPSLATFSASVSGGFVNLIITATQASTIVSFIRYGLNKLTAGIPTGDLGWVDEAVTAEFDAGFDLDPTTSTFDYGYLS